MNLKETLRQALDEAHELKSLDRELTEEELARAKALPDEIAGLRTQIAERAQAQKALTTIAADENNEEIVETKAAPITGRARAMSFGDTFINSPEYKSFQKLYPSGVGSDSPVNIQRTNVGNMSDYFVSRKSTVLGTPLNHDPKIRYPMVDLVDRNRLSLLDLVSRGQCNGAFEYVQVTEVDRQAAIYAEDVSDDGSGKLKPISTITTAIADAKPYTYADGYEITRDLLSDAPAFASYMNSELAYSLDSVIEDKLLNGTGTSGEPKGILSTTGVQEQQYAAATFDEAAAMEFIKATRKAVTKITRRGGSVDAILLSPEMDEAIDLLQDANNRFFSQGPFGSGPATLWGRPRVTSDRLEATTAIVGDFKQVALLDREGLSVNVFDQHKDYAQRNRLYVRAELRAAQTIWRPNRLCVVKKAA